VAGTPELAARCRGAAAYLRTPGAAKGVLVGAAIARRHQRCTSPPYSRRRFLPRGTRTGTELSRPMEMTAASLTGSRQSSLIPSRLRRSRAQSGAFGLRFWVRVHLVFVIFVFGSFDQAQGRRAAPNVTPDINSARSPTAVRWNLPRRASIAKRSMHNLTRRARRSACGPLLPWARASTPAVRGTRPS